MTLEAGASIGPYKILGTLGAGGMGEVYRGRDTRLDRLVAIKILPDSFAGDSERVARFEREAKTLAALNHPNVAQIYGLEDWHGRRALAMELVEGEDLAHRLQRGPIPVDEALAIAGQVADGLEAAHELGIVHRDLKPSNIQLRTDGTAKILDFGLAKALAPGASATDAISSPTITSPAMTARGMVLGTAAYMAPEQAKGRTVDKRADIWAFGVVLYEMVTGRRAFEGDDVSEMLAGVLRLEPDWARVPPQLHRLLKSCLEKDPRKRLHDIGDWLRLIDEVNASAASAVARTSWLPWAVAVVSLAAAAWISMVHFREVTPELPPVRFQVRAPEGRTLEIGLTLSPDGRRLAYTARDPDGMTRIWLRDFDAPDSRPVTGTEGARSPVWSPDGRTLGFTTDRQMKRVDASGGSPITLFEVNVPAALGSATWNASGVILFGGTTTGALRQVSAMGGTPMPVTQVEQSRRELVHGLPLFLPDGRHFLYFRVSRDPEYMGVYVGSLDAKPEEQSLTRLIASDSWAVFARSPSNGDHVLFLQKGTLMARPFDPTRLEFSGDPVVVADQVSNFGALGLFTASANGTLAYRSGPGGRGGVLARLTWMDRQGKAEATVGDPSVFTAIALSPDGTRAIFRDASITQPDLWSMELGRGIATRLTSSPEDDFAPVWSPDMKRVAHGSRRAPNTSILIREVNGSNEEPAVESGTPKQPSDWSSDGRFLVYEEQGPKTGADLWVLPLDGNRKPVLILGTTAFERGARLSPDMRSIAYVSDESGRNEIYLRPFDPAAPGSSATGHTRLSKDGGESVRWRRDGKELVYQATNGLIMSVAFGPSGPDLPTPLFTLPQNSIWAVSADAQRFLVTVPETSTGASAIDVVMNWRPR